MPKSDPIRCNHMRNFVCYVVDVPLVVVVLRQSEGTIDSRFRLAAVEEDGLLSSSASFSSPMAPNL